MNDKLSEATNKGGFFAPQNAAPRADVSPEVEVIPRKMNEEKIQTQVVQNPISVGDAKTGGLVYMRYLDIGLFRDKNNPSNCGLAEPFVMEVVGWVIDRGSTYNLVFEWACGKWDNGRKERRPHGDFAIPKSLVLEMRRLRLDNFYKEGGGQVRAREKNDGLSSGGK